MGQRQIVFEDEVVKPDTIGAHVADAEQDRVGRDLHPDGPRRHFDVPGDGCAHRDDRCVDEGVGTGTGDVFSDEDVERPDDDDGPDDEAKIPHDVPPASAHSFRAVKLFFH